MLTLNPSGRLVDPLVFGYSVSIGLLLGLIGFSFLQLLLPTSLGVDQYWCMYAAKALLAGTHLDGPHLVETNPPLFVWYSLGPVLLANVTRLPLTVTYEFLTMLLTLSSWLTCRRLIRVITQAHEGGRAQALALAVGVIEFFLIQRRPGELTLSLTNLGQKEYFIVIFFLPFLLIRTTDRNEISLGARIFIGIIAGLGVCLKPHQIISILLSEVVMVGIMKRKANLLSPEVIALVATCCSYPLTIAAICPDYFATVFPMMIDTYWGMALHTSIDMLKHQELHHLAVTAVALAAWAWTRRIQSTRAVPLSLLVASIGSGLAYAVQGTGWAYQQLPAWTFLILAVAWMTIDIVHSWATSRSRELKVYRAVSINIGLGISLLLTLDTVRLARLQEARRANQPTIAGELADFPPHTPVYLISTGMPPFQQILQRDLTWGSRYAHLWMLPAIALNEARNRAPMTRPFRLIPQGKLLMLSNTVHQNILDDIRLWRPKVIFVEHFSPQDPLGFDNLRWFLQDGRFFQEWKHYTPLKMVANFDGSVPNAYEEYVRVSN